MTRGSVRLWLAVLLLAVIPRSGQAQIFYPPREPQQAPPPVPSSPVRPWQNEPSLGNGGSAGGDVFYDPAAYPQAVPPSPSYLNAPPSAAPPQQQSPGTSGQPGAVPASTAPASDVQMPPPLFRTPLEVNWGPGFELRTKDDEFSFQIHNLTQLDMRLYDLPSGSIVKDTFTIPREWWIWSGHLTKRIEYFSAFAFGFDSTNVLDLFVNFHYDDRFQFKIGRYKTPFTYEFYTLPIQGLINPERSLFFNNFGLNRDIGAMLHGTVFDKHVDYALGVFNGTRNGFLDQNNAKDVAGYLNIKPFLTSDFKILENFNFGGSFNYGAQNATPIPFTLRTEVATTGNPILGIPFLSFNPGVLEQGQRLLWSMHAAYYYKRLSLISEWQSGIDSYSLGGFNDAIGVQSFYVQAGYFLTGEHVTFRNVVKPPRPFAPGKADSGFGAWELNSRVNYLDINRDIFTDGFADPTLWTNRVTTFDLGLNWYPLQGVKVAGLWEHTTFGDPVTFAPGATKSYANTFWTRVQLYF